jgi:hypothetical protein
VNGYLFYRIVRGYVRMAQKTRHRPAAPSDGWGTVLLDDEEVANPAILRAEAESYAAAFCHADHATLHEVHGCANGGFAVLKMACLEAATLCNAGSTEKPIIRRLLEFALKELGAE